MECRRLRTEDDRSIFDSGEPELDRYFRQFAGQNQFVHHLGVTYVAVEGRSILGFATVSPAQIAIDEVPRGFRQRLPRYPLPVIRLARLAVDRSASRRGVGTALLRHVFLLVVEASEKFGCTGVVVDAKAASTGFYERLGFVHRPVIEGVSAIRPVTLPMFLPLRAIAFPVVKATGGSGSP